MSVRRTAAVAITGVTLALGVPTLANAATHGSASHDARTGAAHPQAVKGGARILTIGGRTALHLKPSTAKVLVQNGVKVLPAGEARVVKKSVAFPIQGGEINPSTLHGFITHDGGLTFRAGGKSLTIRDFRVSTTHKRLTAYVGVARARIPILRVHLGKATVVATKHRLRVSHIGVNLAKPAALALDKYFGTTLFKAGLPIGTVRINAAIRLVYVH